MKQFKAESSGAITEEERETIETLLSYPSLEKVFAENVRTGSEKIRQKMLSTVADLERVVRRGSKEEAAKASIITTAYRTTLDFLDELEERLNSQNK